MYKNHLHLQAPALYALVTSNLYGRIVSRVVSSAQIVSLLPGVAFAYSFIDGPTLIPVMLMPMLMLMLVAVLLHALLNLVSTENLL